MTELSDQTTRRAVLGGVAAVGAGAALAACGGGGSDDANEPATKGEDTSGEEGAASPAPADGVLGTTDEVPVGGGTVYQNAKVVVTQPTEGDFKAFSAVCTHSGCTVGSVEGDTIQCNCHGSQYSATDGSVTRGPAPEALAAKKVEIDGDNIVVS